jgi:proteasome lid subunit RPN8/RPN11
MPRLSKKQIDELIGHSKKEYPYEACGILAGKDGRVEKVYQMTNADKSPKTFLMDPKEQLNVMKDITDLGMKMVGIYHSHIETEAYPSAHDVELAFYPEASYLIISIKDKDDPTVRSFRIIQEKISEEIVKIE